MSYDVVTMLDCAANYGVFEVAGSKGEKYTVTFNGSEGPAHCTCKSFEYCRKDVKDCKHIVQVWDQACLYNPQWHDGQKDPKLRPVSYTTFVSSTEKCPVCGGPGVHVRRAV